MPVDAGYDSAFDSLVDAFAEFMKKHKFVPVEGSRHRVGIGAWEDFENNRFRLRVALDRGDPIINVSKKGEPPDWLLVERLLAYFKGDKRWIAWEVRRIAVEIDQHYDEICAFLNSAGYEQRSTAYNRFAIETVAGAHPNWNLEKTDRWRELHIED